MPLKCSELKLLFSLFKENIHIIKHFFACAFYTLSEILMLLTNLWSFFSDCRDIEFFSYTFISKPKSKTTYLLTVWWRGPAPAARRRGWPWSLQSCLCSRKAAPTAREADLDTPRHDKAWRQKYARDSSRSAQKYPKVKVQKFDERASLA